MFEKEGQRSFDELDDRGVGDDWSIEESYVNGFSNGAEFGYSKANEWHYVKDGDLPKVNELVLIKITGCFVLGWTNGTNWFNDSNNGTIIDRRMVYAWKEIVLPKESIDDKDHD